MENRHEIWELRQMQALPLEDEDSLLRGGVRMDIKLDATIKQLREMKTLAKACATQGVDETEAEVLRAMAEESKQLADWLEELKRYKELEKQGLLVVLPCKIGDTVYEVVEETEPYHSYICEYEVQDVSVMAVRYADKWVPYDYEDLYFTRVGAEVALGGCETQA